MKLAFMSDSHTFHGHMVVPECDILFHTGDFTNIGHVKEAEGFFGWFTRQHRATYKVFIAGNHDRGFDQQYVLDRKYPMEKSMAEDNYNAIQELLKTLPPDVIYLQDSSIELMGLKIYGSPFSSSFHRHNWAFNADRGDEIKAIWDKIPEDTEVLLTHGPPELILDRLSRNPSESLGDEELRTRVRNLSNLKVHAFGHIHENFGQEVINEKIYINSAMVDDAYRVIATEPIVIEL